MAKTTSIKMPGTPPAWLNSSVRLMLHTPGLQRIVGRMFATISVTGAKSGRLYTTPVQYLMHDGDVVVLSQRMRKWWKNIPANPEVGLRLRGRSMSGMARIADGQEARSILGDCLRDEPRVARFYGIEPGSDGLIDEGAIDELLEQVVVIAVETPSFDVELTEEDLAISIR